jgi:hypothetical protein
MKAWAMTGLVPGGDAGSETHPGEKARRGRIRIRLKSTNDFSIATPPLLSLRLKGSLHQGYFFGIQKYFLDISQLLITPEGKLLIA